MKTIEMKNKKTLSWIAAIIVAILLLQTLFFKFTGAPESKFIFETLGVEPWGRIGSGIAELIASILILFPRTRATGAALSAGIIFGAILSHLTVLGIEVMDDGGLLFSLALLIFALSVLLLIIHRSEIPLIGEYLKSN